MDTSLHARLVGGETGESGDAGNYEAALQYFKELNRQGKHLTVVRLYRKAEIRFKEERIPGKYKEQLREQYIYANESIVYLERALDDKSYKNFRGYQESTADNNQSWKELLKPVIWRYLRLGFFTVAVIWFFKIIMGATNNGLDQCL